MNNKSENHKDTMTLYHATSSQVLSKIISEGKLSPPADTGVTSNGLGFESSGEQNGVYLAETEQKAELYYQGAVDSTIFDSRLPNVGVLLKLNVDTKSLIADYDDLDLDNNFKDISWQESLEEIEQVVHKGSIKTSDIESVMFVGKMRVGDNLATSMPISKQWKIIQESLSFGQSMALDEANVAINELNSKTKSIGLKKAVDKQDMDSVENFLIDGAIPDKETKLLMIKSEPMKEKLTTLYNPKNRENAKGKTVEKNSMEL